MTTIIRDQSLTDRVADWFALDEITYVLAPRESTYDPNFLATLLRDTLLRAFERHIQAHGYEVAGRALRAGLSALNAARIEWCDLADARANAARDMGRWVA